MTSRRTDLREIDERERENGKKGGRERRKGDTRFSAVHMRLRVCVRMRALQLNQCIVGGMVRDAKRFEVSVLHGHAAAQ